MRGQSRNVFKTNEVQLKQIKKSQQKKQNNNDTKIRYKQ